MPSNIFSRLHQHFLAPDRPIVVPYRGFANADSLYLKGRVLDDKGILADRKQGRFRNLYDNLRRIRSEEIHGAKIVVQLYDKEHHLESDQEGYFTLNLPWQWAQPEPESQWLSGSVRFLENAGSEPAATYPVEVLYPSLKASFGLLSDIDDTVLQTFVTSRFKLKMMYATMFEDSQRRLPMEGMADLLQALERGADGVRLNPIFYVSDSPWNLYDMLAQFMQFYQIPKGPILLRDYGVDMLWPRKGQPVHKLEAFRQIMKMYPHLPFVMLGDTASMDADYYLKMAEEYPGRALAIYIRQTRDTANAQRIAKLLKEQTLAHARLVQTTAEMRADMITQGLLWG